MLLTWRADKTKILLDEGTCHFPGTVHPTLELFYICFDRLGLFNFLSKRRKKYERQVIWFYYIIPFHIFHLCQSPGTRVHVSCRGCYAFCGFFFIIWTYGLGNPSDDLTVKVVFVHVILSWKRLSWKTDILFLFLVEQKKKCSDFFGTDPTYTILPGLYVIQKSIGSCSCKQWRKGSKTFQHNIHVHVQFITYLSLLSIFIESWIGSK